MTPTSTTDEAYGAGGNLLLRYTGDSNSRSFVPFAGGILAEYYCGGMIFDHPDEIGSLTTATNCAGNVVQERLSYPFGEFWNGAGSLGMHQLFAQLPDYDPETDQYNTENRHYTPSGRWLSPDPDNAGANPQDPQTWNMYAYVRNNPTTLTDPLGLYTVACSSDAKQCEKEQENFENQRQKDLNSKDVEVQNAAKAWGNFGDTGVTVTFASQQQVNADSGATLAPGENVGGFIRPGQTSDHQPDIQAEFSTSLGGSDLRQAIGHEGVHVSDDLAFLNSYDPLTGKFSAGQNLTHYETEFGGYIVGGTVKRYNESCGGQPCSFGGGRKDWPTIDRFLRTSPAYAPYLFNLVFDPVTYPQQ